MSFVLSCNICAGSSMSLMLSARCVCLCVSVRVRPSVTKRHKAHLKRLDRRWTLGGVISRQQSRGEAQADAATIS